MKLTYMEGNPAAEASWREVLRESTLTFKKMDFDLLSLAGELPRGTENSDRGFLACTSPNTAPVLVSFS